MPLSFHAITFDCADPVRLADFWARVLGREVDASDYPGIKTIGYGGEEKPFLVFQRVEEPKVGTNRVHADIATRNFEAELERILGLGASKVKEYTSPLRYTTLADPEGNLFDLADE